MLSVWGFQNGRKMLQAPEILLRNWKLPNPFLIPYKKFTEWTHRKRVRVKDKKKDCKKDIFSMYSFSVTRAWELQGWARPQHVWYMEMWETHLGATGCSTSGFTLCARQEIFYVQHERYGVELLFIYFFLFMEISYLSDSNVICM